MVGYHQRSVELSKSEGFTGFWKDSAAFFFLILCYLTFCFEVRPTSARVRRGHLEMESQGEGLVVTQK